MPFAANHLGQVALTVSDVDRAERFYGDTLGLRKLFRFGDLLFFDMAGVRLLVEKAGDPSRLPCSSVLYFRCADIAAATEALRGKGVPITSEPHRIARLDDHDLWMSFFEDPDRNSLALMHEAPKGYQPGAAAG